MITLIVPVVDMHNYTYEFLKHVDTSVNDKGLVHIVIVDNNSSKPYELEELRKYYNNLSLKRNAENMGYFYPLQQIYKEYPRSKYIGLCHNDIFIYERGWESEVIKYFEKYEKLYLLGFAGTTALDKKGGYASSMKANLLGIRGQSQFFLGDALKGFAPAMAVDSLFMLFRTEAIPILDIKKDVSLYHWYDRIWSLKLIKHGFRVGLYGASIDHKSGVTAFNQEYREDALNWCRKNGVDPNVDPDEAIYNHLQKKFVEEYYELIPSRIDKDWNIKEL